MDIHLDDQEKSRLNSMLRRFVRERGGRAAAADLWETSERTLAGYISGESDPKLSFLSKVAATEGISVADFFIGRAETYTFKESDAVQVPLMDVYASAGPGGEAIDEAPSRLLSFDPYFVKLWGIPPERVVALESRGISMLPTIQDGGVVLVDTGDRKLREKPVFAFRTSDGVRFKRYQRTIDGGVLLVSDNREVYAPERVDPSDLEHFRIIGRAFWTWRMI